MMMLFGLILDIYVCLPMDFNEETTLELKVVTFGTLGSLNAKSYVIERLDAEMLNCAQLAQLIIVECMTVNCMGMRLPALILIALATTKRKSRKVSHNKSHLLLLEICLKFYEKNT